MPGIHETLDAILTHLRENGAPVARALLPGLKRAEIACVFDSRGLVPSRELELLYEWRNGAPMDAENHFYPWSYFMTIEEAADTYDELKGLEDTDYWPCFTNLGGDYEYSVCAGERAESAPVFTHIHDAAPPYLAYESLSAMLETIRECFAEGAYYWEDGPSRDLERCVEIEMRLNPGIHGTE